ncbi:protein STRICTOSIDINE SYNTHASE-LIKE 12-like [Alnus glutinosa]|uniref:protein STRICTOSIDINE SYNTHASE-LIKE 12-like n=1 Tax=Alnus glutinosa TaxID=3517 RepID=UPI002D79B1AD|nr:protein STRICTOSIDINE SYNTHASE-LIKE 12-like [Alnus glutinosa]
MATLFSLVLTKVAILLLCIAPISLSLTFKKIPLPTGATGPASFAFDLFGGPYVGVQDSRILKYEGPTTGFINVFFVGNLIDQVEAVCDGQTNDSLGPTCGWPFGLDFNILTQQLYVADAYFGLLVVGSNGRLGTILASGVNGTRFRFLNSVGLDPLIGVVYFTEFSVVYQLSNITQVILNGDATGSLLKYDPKTRQVTVLLTRLFGAARVAVSANGAFVLVSEQIGQRIQRFWIKGPKRNTTETFITFQGRPNKITRTGLGDFLVAVNVITNQSTQNVLPTVVRINAFGTVVKRVALDRQYNDTGVTEVIDHLGEYYIGSQYVNVTFVGVYGIL